MDLNVDSTEKKTKKRPLSMVEAIRLYRDKKKAKFEGISLKFHAAKRQLAKRLQDYARLDAEYQEKTTKAALLEKEVVKLKALNEHLTERLQGETTLFEAEYTLLEQEVVELKALNEALTLRVQGQAVLEDEITRLKSLLVEIRGKLDGEIGSFRYPEPTKKSGGGDNTNILIDPNREPGASAMNPDNIQGENQLNCLNTNAGGENGDGGIMNGEDLNGCEIENLQRVGAGFKELPGCGIGNVLPPADVIQCDDQLNSLHPDAEGKNGEDAIINAREIEKNDGEVENLPITGSHINSGMQKLILDCGKGNGLPSANTTSKRSKNEGLLLSFLSLFRPFHSG